MRPFLLIIALLPADTSGPPTRGKPLATAKIEYVDRAFGMVSLAAGEPDGVDAASHFIVVRPGRHGAPASRAARSPATWGRPIRAAKSRSRRAA